MTGRIHRTPREFALPPIYVHTLAQSSIAYAVWSVVRWDCPISQVRARREALAEAGVGFAPEDTERVIGFPLPPEHGLPMNFPVKVVVDDSLALPLLVRVESEYPKEDPYYVEISRTEVETP